MSPSNIYSPLDPTKQQIRLLRTARTLDNAAPLICTLEVVSLADSPDFSALSYVWGDAAITEPMTLSGAPFAATANLAAALRRFRSMASDFSARPIWIDALCINQADVAERNAQVLLMAAVYRTARPVLGWLGVARDGSDAGMEMLGRVFDAAPLVEKDRFDFTLAHLVHKEELGWLRGIGELWDFDLDGEPYNSYWQAIEKILTRPYWSRVWILQEVALAKELVFICGSATLRWEAVAHFCLLIEHVFQGRPAREWMAEGSAIPPHLFAYWVRGIPVLMLFCKMRLQYFLQRGGPSSTPRLYDLVWWSKSLGATDPRDKIYGVLSLCDAGHGVVPDYSPENSKKTVYRDFVLQQLARGESLDVLKWCRLDPDAENAMPLPSWVPDWSECRFHYASDSWQAARGTRPSVRTSPDGDVLWVMGMELDVVDTFTTGTQTAEFGYLFEFIIECLEKSKWYTTGIPLFQALARTLVFDECSGPESSWSRDDFVRFVATLTVFCFTHLAGGRSQLNETNAEEAVRRFVAAAEGQESDSAEEQPEMKCYGRTKDGSMRDWWPRIDRELMEQYDDTQGLEHLFKSAGSRLFCTRGSYLGLGFGGVEKGDHVCVFLGCPCPVILRQVDSFYVIVGHCFVLGLMEGQAVEALEDGKVSMKEFEIH